MAELVWETDMVKGTPCLKQLRAFILIIQLVTCLLLKTGLETYARNAPSGTAHCT